MYIPIGYEKIRNINNSYTPSHQKYLNTKVYDFWVRALFQRACSTIILNLPEEWSGSTTDFLYYCLLRYGYVAVFERDELGIVFSPGKAYGINFYYQPTNITIANPSLKKSLDLKIGDDCELLRYTNDYLGIFDIINIHAEKLALLDCAINMSIINNKFAFLISAKNKACAVALKKIFDAINRGEPAVFFDGKLANDPVTKDPPWQFLERQNLQSSYLTDKQLQDFQAILNSFDNEIGIPTLPYSKAERMVTDEANSRIVDSTARISVWKNCLDESMEIINKHFGLNLSCDLRYEPEEKDGDLDATNDINNL